MKTLPFRYNVFGWHPNYRGEGFRVVYRKCLSLPEAENVKRGIDAIGYESKIVEIEQEGRYTEDD